MKRRQNIQHGQRRPRPHGADLAPLAGWAAFLLVILVGVTIYGSPS